MFLNTTKPSTSTSFKKIEVHSNGIILICNTKKDNNSVPFEAIDTLHLTLDKRTVRLTYLYFFVVVSSIFFELYWYSLIVLLVTLFLLSVVTYLLHYNY